MNDERVARYNQWKASLANGDTTMDFYAWETCNAVLMTDRPTCDHPWWAVRRQPGLLNRLAAHPAVKCDICSSEWLLR